MEQIARRLLVAGAVLYLLLFLHNSLTRTRWFSPDSMNYVDVARNIAAGRGISQSTIGFNQPYLFKNDSRIPTPLTAQPPFYPILIAVAGYAGLSHADAALVISAVMYGLTLLLVFLLARHLYAAQTALLSISCLLIYAPLTLVARTAWSETTGLVLVLLTFLLLLRTPGISEIKSVRINCFGAGLAAGLAFATRYALLPLFAVGILFLIIELRRKKLNFSPLMLYVVGFAVPAALVWGHNFTSTDSIMPPALHSDRLLLMNIRNTILSIFGQYLWWNPEGLMRTTKIIITAAQLTLACLVITALVIALMMQRRTYELPTVFISNRRYLLCFWCLGYLSFILYKRTVSHFDDINDRIIVSAGIFLVVLGAALCTKVIERRITNQSAFYGFLGFVIIMVCAREIYFAVSLPFCGPQQQIAQSQRLSWIAQNTTADDLIIGDAAIEVPFYFGRNAAVYFSRYPATIHLTYQKFKDYVAANCRQYRRMYLILRVYDNQTYDEQMYRFGKFITDIRAGHTADYPGIVPLTRLQDALIFEALCQ